MTDKVKQYRADHESIIVLCPCCQYVMSGWTFEEGGTTYWINHAVPRTTGKRCSATKEQMVAVRKEWEAKYEYV